MSDGLPVLLHAQLTREFELAHATYEKRIQLLRQTLAGLATNSTACKMCQLHNRIYEDALARDDELHKRVT